MIGEDTMKTFLFDASAAVDLYAPRNERVKSLLEQIRALKTVLKRATLFIPDICIAEVFNTLARMHFRDGTLDHNQYEKCLKNFRNDIHWGITLYPYNLNRYHIIAADTIIPIEQHRAIDGERRPLSTFDILVIAMACELAHVGDKEKTFLVTCDKRMKHVLDEMRSPTPKEWLIRGPLGDLERSRWTPPTCLYLPMLRPADLK